MLSPTARRVTARRAVGARTSLSPNQRAWPRFKRNRLGFVSLFVFAVMLLFGTLAELFSNDRPLLARYEGHWFFPIVSNPPETRFGGDFSTPTDWHDPFIQPAVREARQLRAVHAQQVLGQLVDYFDSAAPPRRPAAGTGSAPTRRAAT